MATVDKPADGADVAAWSVKQVDPGPEQDIEIRAISAELSDERRNEIIAWSAKQP